MIYFDNAATTFYKPPEVIDAVTDCLKNYSFNANRGAAGGKTLAFKILEAREKVAHFFSCETENVTFTSGCTAALNLAILGGCKRGGHVISSVIEHNSVIRPLKELEKRGIISLTLLTPDDNGHIRPEQVLNAARRNTYMVVLSHVSNVTGYTQDIAAIGNVTYKYDICLVVDAAQSAGYIPLGLKQMKARMICIPAHKGLHGMQGTGILCFDSKFQPEPLIFGGTGSDSENPYQPAYYPDRLESGTQNAPGIIALSAAIDWWKKDSINRLKRIKELSDYLREELNSLPDVKVYSVPNYSGIVSFNLIGRDSNEVGDLLANKYGIATRSGLHCAPLIHKHLGTFPDGMVRLSVSGENTMEECEYFVESLRQIIAAH